MRILFVNENRGYFGGVEQNVAEVADALRSRGHQCFLAYGVTTDRKADKYMSFFDGCFPCAAMGPPNGDPTARPFDDIVRQVAPEVIYFHKLAELPRLDQIASNIRTLRMVHDHDLCCPRRHKYFMVGNRICHHRADVRCWLDGAFLDRTQTGLRFVNIGRKIREMRRNYAFGRILVASHFMKEELVQNGFSPEKVLVVPLAVRLKPCAPSDVPKEKKVLFVGQLIHTKGVDLLLRALQKVSCPFTATIVGTGNAQGRLQALSHRLELSDKVRFQGWVSHDEMAGYYLAAKLLVVPSRWAEPFGMIGPEAMHHGRPVVAFDVGGIPDWLEHEVTGLLVPEQDIMALARSLERLLTDTELARTLGRNAYERARQRYVFDQYIAKLESHLRGDPLPTRGL